MTPNQKYTSVDRLATTIRVFSFAFLLAFISCLSISIPFSFSESEPEKIQMPEEVTQGLGYLLGVLGKPARPEINPEKTIAIVDFVLSNEKVWPAMYFSKDDFGPESAYHEFEVGQSLEEIVEYAYSPIIPSQAVIPSSIRISYWKKNEAGESVDSWSWKFPLQEGAVQVVAGIEYEETTPDTFSGTYYGYDLERLLILFRDQGRKIFFSLSRQKNKSPGKKAYALGDDRDWTYLYTDEPGMNKSGMGWVKPYMYESFAVTVFIERDEENSRKVKCAMFKWLDAGAAGMNMVSTRHINAGIRRFENAFKTVMENPALPSPNELADTFVKIDELPLNGLKAQIELYLNNVRTRYRQEDVFKDEKLAKFFTSPEYLNQLNKRQMAGIIGVEYIKHVLGKDPIIQTSALLSRTHAGPRPVLARTR